MKKKIQPLTSFHYPNAQQGIVFPYVPDTKIRDYLVATAKIFSESKHIIAASRIGNNRATIFLDNETLVDTLVETFLSIANCQIRGHRLKNKPKKLVLSNVSFTTPNALIEKFLASKLKLKLASKILLLRVNPNDDEL